VILSPDILVLNDEIYKYIIIYNIGKGGFRLRGFQSFILGGLILGH